MLDSELIVLRTLCAHGEMSWKELFDSVKLSSRTLSKRLKGLESERFIERSWSTKERGLKYKITEKGQKSLGEISVVKQIVTSSRKIEMPMEETIVFPILTIPLKEGASSAKVLEQYELDELDVITLEEKDHNVIGLVNKAILLDDNLKVREDLLNAFKLEDIQGGARIKFSFHTEKNIPGLDQEKLYHDIKELMFNDKLLRIIARHGFDSRYKIFRNRMSLVLDIDYEIDEGAREWYKMPWRDFEGQGESDFYLYCRSCEFEGLLTTNQGIMYCPQCGSRLVPELDIPEVDLLTKPEIKEALLGKVSREKLREHIDWVESEYEKAIEKQKNRTLQLCRKDLGIIFFIPRTRTTFIEGTFVI